MTREPPKVSPRHEALRDERDHLRIKISMAEDEPGFASEIVEMRKRLRDIDREMMNHGTAPNA